MSEELWIVFPRWDGKDGFQHYRNRDPIWIKNYVRLTSSDEYRALSLADRGLLHGLWLEYARSGRALRVNAGWLGRRLGQRVYPAQIERLNHAGFLTLSASKPLAPRYQDASPEERREELETPPTPPQERGGVSTGKRKSRQTTIVTCPHCRLAFKAQPLLDEHLYHSHDGPEPSQWADTAREPVAETSEDADLPAPEERQRIAATIRAHLADPSTNGSAEELPWEGDAPPAT